jgi:hypothetical protein
MNAGQDRSQFYENNGRSKPVPVERNPSKPVPGEWRGSDLAAEEPWRVPIPDDALSALAEAVARLTPDAVRLPPSVVPSPALVDLANQVREHLSGPNGFVVLTGFPVGDDSLTGTKLAYWTLGMHLGPPVSQDRNGTLIAHVEDRGADISRHDQRGHQSAAALPFHADRTDLVSLLCVRGAASGGLSRLASSAAVHNTLLDERPDLLAVLYDPLPHDRRGEHPPDETPWCALPVFSSVEGNFTARYVRRFIVGSQRWPDAPRLTPRQLEALDYVDEILQRPGVALTMTLAPGDVQIIDNLRLLHARSAFEDERHARGRLLLRLWLAHSASPPLPASYSALYGSVQAGVLRGGVWPDGAWPPDLGVPVKRVAESGAIG